MPATDTLEAPNEAPNETPHVGGAAAAAPAADPTVVVVPAADVGADAPWAPWQDWPPSTIASHHEAGGDAACCRAARAWFRAMSRSLWRGQGAPAWIGRQYAWGPTCWPTHWCEVVGAKAICCGAQAALGVEAFRDRGVDAVPVQLVQRFGEHDAAHWRGMWAGSGASDAWLGDGLVYHEACAVLEAGRARVWDPTASMWASPEEVRGYGSIAAIRVGGGGPEGGTVRWGELTLPLGRWASPLGAGAA